MLHETRALEILCRYRPRRAKALIILLLARWRGLHQGSKQLRRSALYTPHLQDRQNKLNTNPLTHKTMHLDLRYFSTSELHYWRGTFLRICDDCSCQREQSRGSPRAMPSAAELGCKHFAAQAFPDWDDEGFRILHDLHTVLLDEIDRRSSENEAQRSTAPTKPKLPCETIRILED